MLLHFSDLAPIQIHNHAYSPVGIHSEKTGYKHKWHKWHKLYFTQQQRTETTALYLKVVLYIINIITRYVKNFLKL
jgi:hypothetical protein